MTDVFKVPYEIVGAGIPIAEKFYAEIDAAMKDRWEFITSLGADGYRPGWQGTIRSLLFKEVPDGWRKIGTDQGRAECIPHKGSKAGKEIARRIADAPRVTPENDLAYLFGWEGRSPFDGRLLYHAAVTKMEFPRVRYLMRIPREANDGFVPPDTLVEIKQSEYAKAFEDHNEAVRLMKQGKSA